MAVVFYWIARLATSPPLVTAQVGWLTKLFFPCLEAIGDSTQNIVIRRGLDHVHLLVDGDLNQTE